MVQLFRQESFWLWYITWGGTRTNPQTTTLNGALNAMIQSGTTIVLTDASQFPNTGTNFIQIDNEEISYTGSY